MFTAVNGLNRSRLHKLPAAVNLFTAAGVLPGFIVAWHRKQASLPAMAKQKCPLLLNFVA
jgi:hypothetical protein